MHKFYTDVDTRSRKAMTNFLINHFRYPTANSWNRSTSYACNVKIYNLGLDQEIEDKLYQMLQVDSFFDELRLPMDEFDADHNYQWQAGMNGRSGGYLVLYQGYKEASGYKSFCRKCGQLNYTCIKETGTICGRCRENARNDFTQVHMRIGTYPGRSTDMDEDFEDWSLCDLRDRVYLVQEFDKLADDLVETAVDMANRYNVEEQIVMVPKKVMMLV